LFHRSNVADARVGSGLARKDVVVVVAQTETEIVEGIGADYAAKYGFSNPDEAGDYFFKSGRGISHEVVEAIAEHKNEPSWMRDVRHRALDYFLARPLPTWGADLSGIDFENIYYYIRPTEKQAESWEDLPPDIKDTWDKLGIPEAEKNYLAGVGAQYESEVVYHKLQESLEKKGVIFLDMDSGLREHEDVVKQYFATVIPANDNKFAALNSAVWSGGSFIYVPPGVSIDMPLQAYFRINAENMGQFERTMIIVDEGAYVHYVEGCTAPIYSSDSLHSAVVEIIVKKGGRCRYTTIQNWSNNVYNLVTKRAVAHEHATMEWVDGNLGSKVTMKYPAIWLMGEGAHGEVLSIAFAGKGQHQDAGGKVVHVAKNTSSVITSKSISKDGGRGGYRGLLEVAKGATGSKSKVVCDALILDEDSRSDTYPYIDVKESDVDLGHEATVSKIGEEQLFYLMSRGLSEAEASAMIVSGFIEPIVKELPLEYAVEMNRLIQLQMEGSVG
jgi:Fe-S cluster assembly protein SufB